MNNQKGDIFGYEDFVCQNNRKLVAVAKTITSTGSVQYSHFYDLLRKYPEEFEKFCLIRDNANFQKILDISVNVKCLCCNQKDHQVQFCPSIHFQANKKSLIDKWVYNKDQCRAAYYKRKKSQKYKCFSFINDLKITQIKFQQTDLIKDLKRSMGKKQQNKQVTVSEQIINEFSEPSDSQSDSSFQSTQQCEQLQTVISNKEVSLVKSKTQQEQELLDQGPISISNCDTNSHKSRTTNNQNQEDIRKQKQLFYITQKSREQARNQNSFVPSISNMNESLYEIYEQQQHLPKIEEVVSSQLIITDRQVQKEQIQINPDIICQINNSENNFVSVTNQPNQDDKKNRISIIQLPEQTIKQLQELSQNQIQVLIKPFQGTSPTIKRGSLRYAPRKSEYFKGRKIGQSSLNNLIPDHNSLSYGLIPPSNLSKYEVDQQTDLKTDKELMHESNPMFAQNKKKTEQLTKQEEERQHKYFIDYNFWSSAQFDIMKSYKYYFPHNNVITVLNNLYQYKLKMGIQQKKLIMKKVFKQRKLF